MSCSRCGAAIVTPEQAERGLCAMCLTGASLSALVGIAASHQPFMAPIYFGRADFEGLPAKWPSDTEWKREQFPQAAGPTPADRQAAIAAHQPVTDAWGVEWVPVPRSEVQ